MNLVRLRLAPQPRSLVGAHCALDRKDQARTPHCRRPTTGAIASDRQYAPPDDSLFNDSWLSLEPQHRFPRCVRASDQSSECRGSARAPPRHDRRTRTSAISASGRCLARSLACPNGRARLLAEARACLRSKLRARRAARGTPPPGPVSGTTGWGPESLLYKFQRGSGDRVAQRPSGYDLEIACRSTLRLGAPAVWSRCFKQPAARLGHGVAR